MISNRMAQSNTKYIASHTVLPTCTFLLVYASRKSNSKVNTFTCRFTFVFLQKFNIFNESFWLKIVIKCMVFSLQIESLLFGTIQPHIIYISISVSLNQINFSLHVIYSFKASPTTHPFNYQYLFVN